MMFEKLRFKIAEWFNRKSNYCWTTLVLWVMYGERKLTDCKINNECYYPDGSCYCGKIKKKQSK